MSEGRYVARFEEMADTPTWYIWDLKNDWDQHAFGSSFDNYEEAEATAARFNEFGEEAHRRASASYLLLEESLRVITGLNDAPIKAHLQDDAKHAILAALQKVQELREAHAE